MSCVLSERFLNSPCFPSLLIFQGIEKEERNKLHVIEKDLDEFVDSMTEVVPTALPEAERPVPRAEQVAEKVLRAEKVVPRAPRVEKVAEKVPEKVSRAEKVVEKAPRAEKVTEKARSAASPGISATIQPM